MRLGATTEDFRLFSLTSNNHQFIFRHWDKIIACKTVLNLSLIAHTYAQYKSRAKLVNLNRENEVK